MLGRPPVHRDRSRLRRSHVAALCLIANVALFVTARPAAAQGGYVVIVNPENPATSLSQEAVARLFLKKVARWTSGEPVQPVDLAEASELRDLFTKTILGRSVAAVKSYWQQQIYSGRGVPPVEKANEAEVIAFVRSNPGAIAYVSATAAQAHGVRAVSVE